MLGIKLAYMYIVIACMLLVYGLHNPETHFHTYWSMHVHTTFG